MINWNVSKEDHDTLVALATRVKGELNTPDEFSTVMMDFTACHANGCALKLKELLVAERFDFSHDYFGIRQHINRKTGQLEGCFLPRYAAPEAA